MIGSDLVARALALHGIRNVFGLTGYFVAPMMVSCQRQGIRILDTRHEQAAIHMADATAQVTGRPGVALVIGGPGIANSVGGIMKAYYSHTPMVVISGCFDPPRKDGGGLEDIDQLSVVRPITKWCATVHSADRIPEYVAMAFRHATCGRRGPVVLEIPIQQLRAPVDERAIAFPVDGSRATSVPAADPESIDAAMALIARAERPVVIGGNGLLYSDARQQLLEFTDRTGFPAYTVAAGRGVLPDDAPACLGSGRVLEAGPQNEVYPEADLVVVLGASLDYSLGFGRSPAFGGAAKVIQVDVDPCEIGTSRTVDVGIVGTTRQVLRQLNQALAARRHAPRREVETWVERIRAVHQRFWATLSRSAVERSSAVHPYALLKALDRALPRDRLVVADGSNAMLWASLMMPVHEPGHLVIGPSGTYGGMGAGLPLALGAKVAAPQRPVLLYTGDGSLGFNLMEVDTALRHRIPVVVVVHNDAAWGFCRSTQGMLYGEDQRHVGTDLRFVRYDEIVRDFGGKGHLVEDVEEIPRLLTEALASDVLTCINVRTDPVLSPGAQFLNDTVRPQRVA